MPPPEVEEAPAVAVGAGSLMDSSRFNIPATQQPPPAEEAVPADYLEQPAEEAVPAETFAPAEEYAPPPAEEAVPAEEAASTDSILPAELAAPAEEAAPTTDRGSRVLWVDSIIAGKRAAPPADIEVPEPVGQVVGRRKPRLVPWIILIFIMIFAAAGGVYMFGRKAGLDYAALWNSATNMLSGKPSELWSSAKQLFSSQQAVPMPEPGVNEAADEAVNEAAAPQPPVLADQQVSLTVLLGREKQPGGTAVSVQTRVIETDVAATQTFPATGKGPAPGTGGIAIGTLKLINKTSQPMSLIVKTRCLSKDGVLFRLKGPATIPANGSVEAEVYADQPGPSGDIGPTTFTIPGLSADVQKVVYAESSGRMSGGGSGETAKAVTADDVSKAKTVLADRLKAEAMDNLKAMAAKTELVLAELVTSQELSGKAPAAGTVSADFSLKLSLRFRALLVPTDEIDKLLADQLKLKLPAGAVIADYGLGQAQYTVEAYDPATDLAEVRVDAAVKKQ